MKNRLSKAIAIFLAFCVAFSGLPFLAGNLEANALAKKKKTPKNITLQAAASGQTQAVLKWNKVKSPGKGYAVFRDGEPVKHYNTKKTAFTDNDLEAGTSYTYQIKTYTKKTVKMWFNKKTEKWQKKKPAKKYRGKSKKQVVYTYKKKSNAVTIHTAAAPAPVTPSTPSDPTDTGDSDTGNNDSTGGNGNTDNPGDNAGTGGNGGNDNTGGNTGNQGESSSSGSAQETYTITWKNWNGTVLATDTVKAGEVPSYSGDKPKRPADENIYEFTGWSPAVTAASSDATYTAQFKATPRFTIIWKNWDGTVLKTDYIKSGIKPVYPGTPARPEDDKYTYTFSGWSPAVMAADRNATYTAQFEESAKAGTDELSDDSLVYTLVGPSELRKLGSYEYTIAESVPEGVTLKWEVLPYFMTYEAVDDKTIRFTIPEDDLRSIRITVTSIKPDGTEVSSVDEMVPVVCDSEREGQTIGKVTGASTLIDSKGAPDESGNNTMTYTFYTNGGIDWAKRNYDISVEDVTPEAYREVFNQLQYSGGLDFNSEFETCVLRVEESEENIRFVDCTKVTITIKAGPAVRIVKIYDKNGHAFDIYREWGSEFADEADTTVYMAPTDHEYSEKGDIVYPFYDELYNKARRSVEKQLWTPAMTTKEKLLAIADYISYTAHYPGSPAVSKKENPEYWNKWAYDGVALFYETYHCPYLNRVMKLHGGITDCRAQSIVRDCATEDLGLEYIYDAENKVVLDKEGVWTGQGSYSSNPSEPGHYTCIYKDADGNLTYIDAAGMVDTCAEHDCESRILDFSKGLN